jgi:hypothetical protein
VGSPSVIFTGAEVALVAGALAAVMPALSEDDFQVVDILLDRALAALPRPLPLDLAVMIARLRDSRPGR